ncbi:MAG: hypothetical protein AB7S26_35080 [Sandaracinaceae bacterium]
MHLTLGGRLLSPGSNPPEVATDCGTWVGGLEVTDDEASVTCPACRVVMTARRAKRRTRRASHSAQRLKDSVSSASTPAQLEERRQARLAAMKKSH